MKKKAIILMVILFTGVLVVIFGVKKEETSRMSTAVGLDAPEVSLRDASGKTYLLSELKGSVVFVNFWASWCQPCKDEMPSIQGLYNRFKDDPRFRMLTVIYRDDYEKAKSFMRDNKYEFPVFTDIEGRSARSYGVTGVPETYIIDKRGTLREKVIGPAEWDSAGAVSLISKLLQE